MEIVTLIIRSKYILVFLIWGTFNYTSDYIICGEAGI
jgi:hypothetical protein